MIYSACLQPHLPKLYKSIAAHISCVCHAPYLYLSCVTLLIAKHTALLSLYPTPPPTTPHPASQNFPRIPQISSLHRMTAQPNIRQKLKHAQLSPYISHLYCAYHMLFLCLHCATAYSFIYCNWTDTSPPIYPVFILYLSCAYLVPILCRFQQAKWYAENTPYDCQTTPLSLPDMKIRPQGFTKQDKHGSYAAEFILCLPCAFHVPMLCLSCAEFDKSTPLPRVTIMLQ